MGAHHGLDAGIERARRLDDLPPLARVGTRNPAPPCARDGRLDERLRIRGIARDSLPALLAQTFHQLSVLLHDHEEQPALAECLTDAAADAPVPGEHDVARGLL